jgi:hypothetical protein
MSHNFARRTHWKEVGARLDGLEQWDMYRLGGIWESDCFRCVVSLFQPPFFLGVKVFRHRKISVWCHCIALFVP